MQFYITNCSFSLAFVTFILPSLTAEMYHGSVLNCLFIPIYSPFFGECIIPRYMQYHLFAGYYQIHIFGQISQSLKFQTHKSNCHFLISLDKLNTLFKISMSIIDCLSFPLKSAHQSLLSRR